MTPGINLKVEIEYIYTSVASKNKHNSVTNTMYIDHICILQSPEYGFPFSKIKLKIFYFF